jgi:hypothetical protein
MVTGPFCVLKLTDMMPGVPWGADQSMWISGIGLASSSAQPVAQTVAIPGDLQGVDGDVAHSSCTSKDAARNRRTT